MSHTLVPTVRAARIGLVQIALAGVLWGTGGLAVQFIRGITPMSVLTLSAYRMLIAAAALGAAVLVLRRGSRVRAALSERPGHAILVGCGTAVYQALYFGSVVNVGVTVSTVIALGIAPVLLTAGESVHARTRPSVAKLLIIATALAGLVLVSGFAGHATGGPRPVLGILLAIASGSTYAATTALGRPLAQTVEPLALTTIATSAGALALLPLALITRQGTPLITTDPTALAWLLHLGVFTMALAYGLLYAGLRTTAGSTAVIAALLEPVTAAIAAALVLGERIGPAGIVGVVLILAGVTRLDRVRTEDEPEHI